ncbi:hypothetical protein [Herbiconiux daphne]|uniref:Uncharacterized protein n=1 Tax=Herbiconiux daphne TaxID=2970914 RepID=A0ABT2H7T7_9MICO|nr:hypothetical protein [Herbiconiux daphne]MCS5736018.1 hypothetical protein [Herbiconiux daphne]
MLFLILLGILALWLAVLLYVAGIDTGREGTPDDYPLLTEPRFFTR